MIEMRAGALIGLGFLAATAIWLGIVGTAAVAAGRIAKVHLDPFKL